MGKSELLNKQTDIELYKQFLKGDKEAFNSLMIRHRKSLIYFIVNYVKNIEVAEDIAQDAFLYMIINKVEYDFKCSFKTYLYTIARSRALNYLKREKRTISLQDIEINNIKFDEDIESNLINKEEKQYLTKNINKLKKEYQIVIYLFYFQEFKYKEICKILNQSMSKTKMSIHRAKKAIEKIWEEARDNNE